MIAIHCPWCQGDTPLELEQLQDAGGRYTCPACLTTVELVELPDDTLSLAA